MKFHDNHKQLFVACGDDDVIDVIDVATLSVVDHIPTGASPEMFELSADDSKLYVSNEEGSSVQEINLSDKIISREFPTGAEPEGIAVTPDEKTVYVTSEASDLVHVIDTAAGAVADDIVVGTRPRRFLQLPNNELWVSNELSGGVSVIDRATNKVSTTLKFVPPGFHPRDVTPVDRAINFLLIAVLGGARTIAGPVLGALFVTALPNLLSQVGDIHVLVYAAFLIAAVIFLPGGFGGAIERLWKTFGGSRRSAQSLAGS
jgi:YVTN family beta-propeller protein